MSRLRRARVLFLSLAVTSAILSGAGSALLGVCGPFTDVTDAAFCPFVLEVFTLAITTGTSPTTYDPSTAVSRLQMAAFLSRSVDATLKRGSRRAAMNQFWTRQSATVLDVTTVGDTPRFCRSDGADIWVSNGISNTVSRVRASDGRLLETWTGATSPRGVLVAMDRVLVTGVANPGKLYMIDPSQPAGAVTTVATNLANSPFDATFDGARVWTSGAGVSIITPGATIPWTVTTVTTGLLPSLLGLVFDGANVWCVDGANPGRLRKLDSAGAVLLTVTVGNGPENPVFDGTNIWVPNNNEDSVTVVRATGASAGTVLQTLTGNGIVNPHTAAFDGQRVLVTGFDSVSLWKAADLTPLGSFPTGASSGPGGACSDGMNFWLCLLGSDNLARF